MSTQTGRIIPGTLPYLCFPSDPQIYANDLLTLASVQFPGLTGIIISDSQPSADDRDKLWIKTSAGAPTGYQFVWFNGAWVWPNPVAANSDERRLWVGTEASLVTYDGGDSGAAGNASGPMWAVDHLFDGRAPFGPGAVPGSTPALTLNVGDTGGEGSHALTADENGPHTHVTKLPRDGAAPDTLESTAIATHDQTVTLPWTSESSGLGTPHNNMPPYYGCFVIKRTSRLYYRGA